MEDQFVALQVLFELFLTESNSLIVIVGTVYIEADPFAHISPALMIA